MASQSAANASGVESARSFFEELERRCKAVDSMLCVGLDPHDQDLDKLAKELAEGTARAEVARVFCTRLIEKTAACAAAYKPNAAFFEALGDDGAKALREVMETIKSAGLADGTRPLVLLDAKRGDIGSTCKAYAKAAFAEADCVTVNAYMGEDCVEPFLTFPATKEVSDGS